MDEIALIKKSIKSDMDIIKEVKDDAQMLYTKKDVIVLLSKQQMQKQVEIDESQLICHVFTDFGNGVTFYTSMDTTIDVAGNFCQNYKLYSKQLVEHVLQNGTAYERLKMMSDLSFDNVRIVKNDGDNTEYFIGQNMIGNFDYNLKIVNDDFKSNVHVYEGNPHFIKKEYMFDARAIVENRRLELFNCIAYSDGRLTFDAIHIYE